MEVYTWEKRRTKWGIFRHAAFDSRRECVVFPSWFVKFWTLSGLTVPEFIFTNKTWGGFLCFIQVVIIPIGFSKWFQCPCLCTVFYLGPLIQGVDFAQDAIICKGQEVNMLTILQHTSWPVSVLVLLLQDVSWPSCWWAVWSSWSYLRGRVRMFSVVRLWNVTHTGVSQTIAEVEDFMVLFFQQVKLSGSVYLRSWHGQNPTIYSISSLLWLIPQFFAVPICIGESTDRGFHPQIDWDMTNDRQTIKT